MVYAKSALESWRKGQVNLAHGTKTKKKLKQKSGRISIG